MAAKSGYTVLVLSSQGNVQFDNVISDEFLDLQASTYYIIKYKDANGKVLEEKINDFDARRISVIR